MPSIADLEASTDLWGVKKSKAKPRREKYVEMAKRAAVSGGDAGKGELGEADDLSKRSKFSYGVRNVVRKFRHNRRSVDPTREVDMHKLNRSGELRAKAADIGYAVRASGNTSLIPAAKRYRLESDAAAREAIGLPREGIRPEKRWTPAMKARNARKTEAHYREKAAEGDRWGKIVTKGMDRNRGLSMAASMVSYSDDLKDWMNQAFANVSRTSQFEAESGKRKVTSRSGASNYKTMKGKIALVVMRAKTGHKPFTKEYEHVEAIRAEKASKPAEKKEETGAPPSPKGVKKGSLTDAFRKGSYRTHVRKGSRGYGKIR